MANGGLITGLGLQAITGFGQAIQGSNLTLLGGEMQAGAYRRAGVASMAATNYNIAIERLNFNRQMDNMSRDIRNFVSTQRTAAASGGFASGSQSTLEIMNDSFDTFERQILQARNSQAQAEKSALFEAQSKQVELENQARAAQFQAETVASQQQASAFGQLGQVFGGLFGQS